MYEFIFYLDIPDLKEKAIEKAKQLQKKLGLKVPKQEKIYGTN